MINKLNTPSSKLQIDFGVLQIDTENSATGDIVTQDVIDKGNHQIKCHHKAAFHSFFKDCLICIIHIRLNRVMNQHQIYKFLIDTLH